MKDYQIDGNKEMVALGAMNIAGSMTSCYVATGNYVAVFDEIKYEKDFNYICCLCNAP